jgi:sigma-B regulation protein RsbU (phosphoserine phosphatase)
MPFTLEARDLEIALLINGAAAIVIGLLFSSFAALQRRLRESVERIKEQEFAEKEIALAREIQTRLLPPENLEGNGYAVAARNIAARFVAGDFYDVFRLSTGELGISVADVSGNGIGASLIMASVKAVLAMMAEGRRASEALTELNVKLSRELGAREFVALAYARFDPASGELEIANAGLPDPYLVRPDGTVETISVPGPRLPLGARPNIAYESFTTSLKPGERVFFLTDGLPEAETAKDEPLGYEALESLLPRRAASPSLFIDQLFSTLRASTSPTLGDDWTALVLEARSRRSE